MISAFTKVFQIQQNRRAPAADSDLLPGLGVIGWMVLFGASLFAVEPVLGNESAKAEPASAGLGTPEANRHPISVTTINAFVTKTRLTLRCSFYADDFHYLHEVDPDPDTGIFDSEELQETFDYHADFLLERIEIYTAAGERLKGRVVDKGPFDPPAAGVDSIRLMDYLLYVTLEYDLDQPPEFLTFQHDIIDANYTRKSEVSLALAQAGTEVRWGSNMKVGVSETVRLDWENALSATATGDELKAWMEHERDETLGLTNYGGVYSFLYVTPYETRLEVLIPVATIGSFIRFEQADSSYVEVEEQQAAADDIKAFLREACPVTINGEVREPRIDRMDFGGFDIRDFAMAREPKRVAMANGRVGVIMAFPTRKLPDEVHTTWTQFDEKYLRDVELVAFLPDKTEQTQFSMYLADNQFVWRNPGVPPLPEVVAVSIDEKYLRPRDTPLPLISIGCLVAAVVATVLSLMGRFRVGWLGICLAALGLGAWLTLPVRFPIRLPGSQPAPVTEQAKEDVFDGLIRNMFRAFDYSSEEDIYDSLATSCHGEMLTEVYLKLRKSLEVKEQGGAIATIDDVEILSGEPASSDDHTVGEGPVQPPDYVWRCRWNLKGSVEHWGHIHQRTNTYDAVFVVRNIDGLWKFTDFQTLDEQQGPVIFGPRKF